MNLLLEYFECPEQPRPVHGDPCAPDVTLCEMSRIRETTRLRLVPPCEIDDSGPIKDFLAEVGKLKKDPVLEPFLKSASIFDVAAPAAIVPFDLKVETIRTGTASIIDSTTIQSLPVSPGSPLSQDDVGFLPFEVDAGLRSDLRVTATAHSGFQFAAATPALTLKFDAASQTSTPVNVPVTNVTRSATEVIWEGSIPEDFLHRPQPTDPIQPAFAYTLQNWQLTDTRSNQFSGNTEIDLTPLILDMWESTPWGSDPNRRSRMLDKRLKGVLHIEVQPTAVSVRPSQPRPFPCLTEACDAEGRPGFALMPFLHEDPTNPSHPADPKVIALAILYAFLAGEMARNQVGTPQEIQTARFELAQALYTSAWKLSFATTADTEKYQLTDALQRLFQAWCKALLYPGPKCLCEPHGVVIGCALVSSGEIQMIDPWGDRRWVVHYPLLSYWGQQFGLMPLDAIASKLFDFICCISELAGPRFPVRQADGTSMVTRPSPLATLRPVEPAVGRSSMLNLGRSVLIFDEPEGAAQRIATLGLTPERRVALSAPEFVSRVVENLMAPSAPPIEPVRLVHFTLTGYPNFHLVAPDPNAGESPPPAKPPNPTRPGRRG
jgi:hypothetical protein